ncbi:MAG: hypothetical protein U1E73_04280 [Planctomycetota bacterium]
MSIQPTYPVALTTLLLCAAARGQTLSEDLRRPVAAPGATSQRSAAADHSAPIPNLAGLGTQTLPDRVQFDRPDARGPLWAIGHSWKASFDGNGFAYTPFFGSDAPRNFPLRIELQHASVGGEALPLRRGQPQHEGSQVRTARGALSEVVDLSLQQAEQSFVFDELPQRGELVVEVRMAGEFQAALTSGGIRFVNDHGAIEYSHAVARDAAGRSQPLDIAWLGDRARIAIPAAFVATAALPLVLDPVLTTVSLTGPYNPLRTQRLPDVARLTVPGITAVIWRRAFSLTDEDVCVRLYDANQNPYYPLVYIDLTANSWSAPSVAACSNSNNFLVVSQVDTTGAFNGSFIGGRLIDSAGMMGGQFAIEGSNLVGLPGNNYRPDVGGDAFPSVQAYFTVVFEHETSPGNNDIYFRQIDQTGGLLTAQPIALDNGPTMQQNPTISAWNGPDTFAQALVAWQSESSATPGDDDVKAAWVNWAGGITVPAFAVASSPSPERRPTVSSIANVVGGLCAAVVWETDFITDSDVYVQLIDGNGIAFSTPLNLSLAEAGGTYVLRNQAFPTVETDGNRFAVGYSEYTGTDYDTYASTVAWLPGTASWRIHDERAALGVHAGTDDYWTRMVADWNFYTPVPNSEYTIVGADIGANDIEMWRYGGWVPGPFFSTYGSQCGALGITASGSPTAGSYVHFDLIGPGPFSGYIFGFPGLQSLPPCPSCYLAVAGGVSVPGPHFTWHVPANPVFVSAFTLSIQGWSFGGSACLGAIDLSNTVDFGIR